MKNFRVALLGIASVLCLSVGVAMLNDANYVANAEEPQATQDLLSVTKYKVSTDQEESKMLLVTAIRDVTDVYEVGYVFTGYTVGSDDIAETTKYYDSLTTGGVTESATEIFGSDWAGSKLIVWEVSNTANVTFSAYAKVGERVGDVLTKPEQEIIKTSTERTNQKYTVTFVDEYGSTLGTQEVYNGKMPTFADPTKEADAQYTYTFAGWDNDLAPVTGDVTYTATYTATVNKYAITFVNNDGSELCSTEVEYGAVPTFDGTPTYVGFSIFEQVFDGWDNDLVEVDGEASYTATYKAGDAAQLSNVAALDAGVWESMGANSDGTYYISGAGRQFGWNAGNFIESQNGIGISNALVMEAKASGFNYLEMQVKPTSWGSADLTPNGTIYNGKLQAYADFCAPGGDYLVFDLSYVTGTEGYTMLAGCGNIVQVRAAKFVKEAITENVNFASAWFAYENTYIAGMTDRSKCYSGWDAGWDFAMPYAGSNMGKQAGEELSKDPTYWGCKLQAGASWSPDMDAAYITRDIIMQAMELGYTKMTVSVLANEVDKVYYKTTTSRDETGVLTDGAYVEVVNNQASFEITLADPSSFTWKWTLLAAIYDTDCVGYMMFKSITFSK